MQVIKKMDSCQNSGVCSGSVSIGGGVMVSRGWQSVAFSLWLGSFWN